MNHADRPIVTVAPVCAGHAEFPIVSLIQMPEEAAMLIRFPRLFESISRPVAAMRANRRGRQTRQRRIERNAAVSTERLEARALLTVTGSGTFVPLPGAPTHSFIIDTSSPSNGNVHSVDAGTTSATFSLTGRIVGPGNFPADSHGALSVTVDGVGVSEGTDSITPPTEPTSTLSFTITNVTLGLGDRSFTYSVGRTGDPPDSSAVPSASVAGLTSTIRINAKPNADDDSFTLDEDEPDQAERTINVLANDEDGDGGGDADDDDDNLTLNSITQPSNGTAVMVGNQIRYTPRADFFGSDSLTYTISDGTATSDPATVNITVNSVIDTPGTIASFDDNVAPVEGNFGTSGSFTNDSRPSFNGTSEAGAAISIRLGSSTGTEIGSTTANSSGDWTVDGADLTQAFSEGSQSLFVRATSGDATSVSDPAFVINVDTIAPDAPNAPNLADDSDTPGPHTTNDDDVTSDRALSFGISGIEPSASVTLFRDGASASTVNPTVGTTVLSISDSGTIFPVGTRTITVDESQVVPRTGDTATATATFTILPTGLEYSIQLNGLDLKADSGDRTSPNDVTHVHLHSGAVGANGDHVLNIFGIPSEDDDDLVVDFDTETLTGFWDDTDATDLNGDLDTNDAAESKPFSNFITQLLNGGIYLQIHTVEFASPGAIRGQVNIGYGTHDFQLSQTDLAGNVSALSTSFEPVIDSTVPMLTNVSLGGQEDAFADSVLTVPVTTEANPAISFTLIEQQFESLDNPVFLEVVQINSDSSEVVLGTSTETFIAGGSDVSASRSIELDATAISSGLTTIKIRATDAAGNSSSSQAQVFVLTTGADTASAPGTPVFNDFFDLATLLDPADELGRNQVWQMSFDKTTQTLWINTELGTQTFQFDPATGATRVFDLEGLADELANVSAIPFDNPHGVFFDFDSFLTPRVWIAHRNATGSGASIGAEVDESARLSYYDLVSNELVTFPFEQTELGVDVNDLHAVFVDNTGTVWAAGTHSNTLFEIRMNRLDPTDRQATVIPHVIPDELSAGFDEDFVPHGVDVVIDERNGDAYVWLISEGGTGRVALLRPEFHEDGRDSWVTWDMNDDFERSRGTFLKIDDGETPGIPDDDTIIGTFPVVRPEISNVSGSGGGAGHSHGSRNPGGSPSNLVGVLQVFDPGSVILDPTDVSEPGAVRVYELPQIPGAPNRGENLAAVNQPFVDREGTVYYADRTGGIGRLSPDDVTTSLDEDVPGTGRGTGTITNGVENEDDAVELTGTIAFGDNVLIELVESTSDSATSVTEVIGFGTGTVTITVELGDTGGASTTINSDIADALNNSIEASALVIAGTSGTAGNIFSDASPDTIVPSRVIVTSSLPASPVTLEPAVFDAGQILREGSAIAQHPALVSYDIDGNGELSQAEVTVGNPALSTLDTNGDMVVSAKELSQREEDRSSVDGLDQYEVAGNRDGRITGQGRGLFRGAINASNVLYGSISQNDAISSTIFAETARRQVSVVNTPGGGRMVFQTLRNGSLVMTARPDGALFDEQINLTREVTLQGRIDSESAAFDAIAFDGDPSAIREDDGTVRVFGKNASNNIVEYRFTPTTGVWTTHEHTTPGGVTLAGNPTAFVDGDRGAAAVVTSSAGNLILFRPDGSTLDLTALAGDVDASRVYASVGVVDDVSGGRIYVYGADMAGSVVEYRFDRTGDIASSFAAETLVIADGVRTGSQTARDVRILQSVEAVISGGVRHVFGVDGSSRLVHLTVDGDANVTLAENVSQLIADTTNDNTVDSNGANVDTNGDDRVSGYFPFQMPFVARVYTEVAPIVNPDGSLSVYGTNGGDLVLLQQISGQWVGANLSKDIDPTSPDEFTPANFVFGAPDAYIDANDDRHILQINASGEIVEFTFDSSEAQFSTQNINLARGNSVTDLQTVAAPPAPMAGGVDETIIDNGDAGYSLFGTSETTTADGFNGDVEILGGVAGPQNGSNIASWQFTGLTEGNYRVSATWSPSANNSTSSVFVVNTGGTTASQTRINQQRTPEDFTASGEFWQDLNTSVSVSDGTLTVLLGDDANGLSIADAIRIERIVSMGGSVDPLRAEGGVAAVPVSGDDLEPEDIAPIFEQARNIWSSTLTLDTSQNAILDSITPAIVDLSGPILAGYSESDSMLFLDINAAGYGWFVDATPGGNGEFGQQIARNAREAGPTSPAADRVDLLTVVLHEMGHALGYDDLNPADFPNALMSQELGTGTRRLPVSETVTIDVNGSASAVTLSIANGDLVVTQSGQQIDRVSLAGVSNLIISGSSSGDSISADFSTPGSVGLQSLILNGNDGDDIFNFVGINSSVAASIEFNGDDGDDRISSLAGLTYFTGGAGKDVFAQRGSNVSISDATFAGVSGIAARLDGVEVKASARHSILDASGLTLLPATLRGSGGHDTLRGGSQGDAIYGMSGNDVIEAGGGNDKVMAGSGNDNVSGGDGNDSLQGNAGHDTIDGGSGDDRIIGHSGKDKLRGGTGKDTINGGAHNDTIRGGGGNDLLLGGRGNDLISGGEGDDNLNGSNGSDSVFGNAGRDILRGGSHADLLVGGSDVDLILGQGSARDTLVGGNGDDDEPDDDRFDRVAEVDNAFAIDTSILERLNF